MACRVVPKGSIFPKLNLCVHSTDTFVLCSFGVSFKVMVSVRGDVAFVQQIDGSTFVISGNGGVEEIRPAIYHPDTLPLHSLEALVTGI